VQARGLLRRPSLTTRLVFSPCLLACLATSGVGCSEILSSTDAQFEARSGPSTAPGGNDLRFTAYLKALEPSAHADFGDSVAVNGSTVAVTAPFEDETTPDGVTKLTAAGATYLFDLDHVDAPPTRLVVPDVGANDGFILGTDVPQGFNALPAYGGLHVALDDSIVVIGVSGDDSASASDPIDDSATDSGAVHVYDRAAASWTRYLKEPQIAAGDLFGATVALSARWLAVGAPSDDSVAKDSGAVYVYPRNSGRFDAPPFVVKPRIAHVGDSFGGALALDGDLLVVGAAGEGSASTGIDGDASGTALKGDGAVYVYRFSTNEEWTEEAYVKPNVASAYAYFGGALSASDGRFVVGALAAGSCGGSEAPISFRGAAYVVAQKDGQWAIEQCISAAHGDSMLGIAVGLSGDRMVAGAPWEPGDRTDDRPDAARAFSGSAAVYRSDPSGLFRELPHLQAPGTEANQIFGLSVGVSSRFVVVGAPWEAGGQSGPKANPLDMSMPKAGAVYVFSFDADGGSSAGPP